MGLIPGSVSVFASTVDLSVADGICWVTALVLCTFGMGLNLGFASEASWPLTCDCTPFEEWH